MEDYSTPDRAGRLLRAVALIVVLLWGLLDLVIIGKLRVLLFPASSGPTVLSTIVFLALFFGGMYLLFSLQGKIERVINASRLVRALQAGEDEFLGIDGKWYFTSGRPARIETERDLLRDMQTPKKSPREDVEAQQLKDAYAKGRKEGLAQGREEGLTKGREDGLVQGREEGYSLGHSEGYKYALYAQNRFRYYNGDPPLTYAEARRSLDEGTDGTNGELIEPPKKPRTRKKKAEPELIE